MAPSPAASAGCAAGELTDDLRSFLAARIEELKQAVAELSPDALKVSFHKALAYPGEGVDVGLTNRELDRQIAPDDIIHVGKRAPLTWTTGTDRDGTACFHLFCGDAELTAKAEWVPFFRHLVERDQFRAEEASTWSDTNAPYPWSAIHEYLQALLEHAVIAVAS